MLSKPAMWQVSVCCAFSCLTWAVLQLHGEISVHRLHEHGILPLQGVS